MTDQQHAKMMSCTGNKWLKTPAMDRIAKAGIRFDRSYCANPVCVPSRISMATGMMPNRLGAVDNKKGSSIKNLPAEVNRHSMGKVMKDAGYDTLYGGKTHLCASLIPKNAGYDIIVRDNRDELPAACSDFINARRDKPFFVVASFINPHDICFAHSVKTKTKKRKNQYIVKLYEQALNIPEKDLPPLPENHSIPDREPEGIEESMNPGSITPAITMRKTYNDRDWRIYRWIYHRLTEVVDKEIGQILDGLEKSGKMRDTLIIFTSDHGDMDASHRLASKNLFYEESVRVPFLMSYPALIPGGVVDKETLVSTGLDILPTLLDFIGAPIPGHLLGRSLKGPASGIPDKDPRSYVAAENENRMIASKRFKYCVYKTGKIRESLVDLEKDPGEMENLAGNKKFKKNLKEHRKYFKEWAKISKDLEAKDFFI